MSEKMNILFFITDLHRTDMLGFIPEDLYSIKFVEENTINFLERYSDGKYEEKPYCTK
ncbi:MAG: hypothetical protein ACFFBH_01405 [Promethearchaeota archaeon]